MTEPSNRLASMDHGEECSCKLLAQALGMDPRALSFEYCHRVLHKHWSMTCRHGRHVQPAVADAVAERWSDIGPVDPVKAILIINDPTGE